MSLTVAECKRIISKGKQQLTAAEKRIEELESLVLDMWETMEADTYAYDYEERLMVRKRMAELGLMGSDTE